MDDVTLPFTPLLQNSSVLHSVASRGRYRSLLGWRPWRSSLCKCILKQNTYCMGVTMVSCDCGYVVIGTDDLIQNKFITKHITYTAYLSLYLSLTAWRKYVFSLYHCKAPDLKYMPFTSLLFYVFNSEAAHVYHCSTKHSFPHYSHLLVCNVLQMIYLFSQHSLRYRSLLSMCTPSFNLTLCSKHT